MSKINICCPYCGSTKMTADVVVKVTGTLTGDGKITAKDIWTPDTFTNEVFPSSASDDITGFCQDCGKECNFSWDKGYIFNKDIAKNTKIYLLEYGEILPPSDPEFESYNLVYDKQHGYYDYEQMYTFDFMKSIKTLKEYHKIDENTDNYYIVVTDQGTLDEYPDDFDIDDFPEGCIYDVDVIVYYEGKAEGKPIKMKNTNINNAIILNR